MAKTKGIRKAKHRKRHSRKKHGGERFETMDAIKNKKTELENELGGLDDNLEKLEVLQYLKSYSELKPRSETFLRASNPKRYQKFIETQTMIDNHDNNPIENYKTYSIPDLKKNIESLETDLREKVRNKKIGEVRQEYNTLKTTCPTKVDVYVEKIRSDGKSKGGYKTTFEGEIKSDGNFTCKADGPGRIKVTDKYAKDYGELRTVDAVDGMVPLQGDDIGKYDEILKTREEAKNTEEKVPEWKEEPGTVPQHKYKDEVKKSMEIKKKKDEQKFLEIYTKSPAYQLDDPEKSPNWEKIYNHFVTNSRDGIIPNVLTKEYEKFMKEKGLRINYAKGCPHEKYGEEAIKRKCQLTAKEKRTMLLAIHPDKQNNPLCIDGTGDKPEARQKQSLFNGIDCTTGGKKKRSKKTQRKRKRKHRTSSRH